MKKSIIVTGFILVNAMFSYGQNCTFYYPQKQGTQLEFKSFDSKNKITGSSIQVIKELKEEENSINALIEVQSFDKKGKDIGKKEFNVKCENGEFSVDMKSFMDAQTMEAYKDMDVKIESNNLELPANLKIGDELPDGNLNISIYSEGMRIMEMRTTITKRKVEAREEVTTDAGTFNCYKITYTITVNTMFSVRMEAAEWIAENIGTVKTETYSRGNTMGYTLLTSIKQ